MNSVKAACCVLPLALLPSASALASYQICMTYCMKQHADFDRCHKTCVEAKAPANGANASPGAAKDGLKSSPGPQKPPRCREDEQKADAILAWAEQHYENIAAKFALPPQNGNPFWTLLLDRYQEVPSNKNLFCNANVRVDKACVVEVVEFVEGDGC